MIILTYFILSRSRLNHEKHYQDNYCNGETEVTMPNRTRCDCVKERTEGKINYGNKWSQSIGQALNYGKETGKTPVLYLIIEKPKDERYYKRVKGIIDYYDLPIELFRIVPLQLIFTLPVSVFINYQYAVIIMSYHLKPFLYDVTEQNFLVFRQSLSKNFLKPNKFKLMVIIIT